MVDKRGQLYRLIHVLKPNEKAYFKKFGPAQTQVQQLFEWADQELKFGKDPESVEVAMHGRFESEFPAQSFTKIKSRLLESLLESIRAYDRKQSDMEKVFDAIATAESLRKRNLFHDAWRILQKAEKLASELELIELVVLIQNKRYYYEIFSQLKGVEDAYSKTLSRTLDSLDLLRRRVETDYAAFRILHFQKSIGVPRSDADLQLLEAIRNHPSYLEDDYSPLTGSGLNLAVARCGLFFSFGDTASVIRVSQHLIDHYAPNRKLAKIHSMKFLSLQDSFLQAALLSLDLPLFEAYYPRFESTPTYGEDDRHLKIGIDTFLRCLHVIIGDRPGELPTLRKTFADLQDKAFIPNYRKLSLAYYLVFASFLYGQYDEAFRHIQWMVNHRQLGLRSDVEFGILGIECAILLEKGEWDLLEYRLRNLDELVKRKERKFKMEGALIRLFRSWLRLAQKEVPMELLDAALQEMQAIIQEDPLEQAFLHTFDVISWLQGKIQGEEFATIYRRNNLVKA